MEKRTKRLGALITAVGLIASIIGIYSFVSGRYTLFDVTDPGPPRSGHFSGTPWGRTFMTDWPGALEVSISPEPFPSYLSENMPEYDWLTYQDDLKVWSGDARFMAFRRCSGYDMAREPAVCLVYLADRSKNYLASLVVPKQQLSYRANFWPIGFVDYRLFLGSPGQVYLATPKNLKPTKILDDAWGVSIRTDSTLAYLSSYRSGEPNLWIARHDFGQRTQLTHFEGCQPGYQTGWRDSGSILFEMSCDDEPGGPHTWLHRLDSGETRKLHEGQIRRQDYEPEKG